MKRLKQNGHPTNNIKKGLIHCAEKPGCKDAIIYFYENNFNLDVFEKALIRYKGLKGEDGPWVAFDEVVCMQNDKIVYQKSPPIE